MALKVQVKNRDKTAECLVDVADFLWIIQHQYYVHRTGAVLRGARKDGKRTTVQLARLILEAAGAVPADGAEWVAIHLNGNKLDNRRANLRAMTQSEAARFHQAQRNEWHGVHFIEDSEECAAWFRGERLGRFKCAQDAGRAWDARARAAGIEEVFLNFPNDSARWSIEEIPARTTRIMRGTGFFGVSLHAYAMRWSKTPRYSAMLGFANNSFHLGLHDTAEDAARQVDAARVLWGLADPRFMNFHDSLLMTDDEARALLPAHRHQRPTAAAW